MKKLWIALFSALMLLSLSTCAFREDLTDYSVLLVKTLASGDVEAARAVAAERNARLDDSSGERPVDFDELLLLSRLIYAKAGERQYSEALRMCVGEVALNRVASPEFPDTLAEVIYQKGQYPCAWETEFAELRPSRDCVRVALRLLQGERTMAPQVVYQSEWRIGPVYVRFYDRLIGYTYFCESVYPELYT